MMWVARDSGGATRLLIAGKVSSTSVTVPLG